jgi:hypothetical protein
VAFRITARSTWTALFGLGIVVVAGIGACGGPSFTKDHDSDVTHDAGAAGLESEGGSGGLSGGGGSAGKSTGGDAGTGAGGSSGTSGGQGGTDATGGDSNEGGTGARGGTDGNGGGGAGGMPSGGMSGNGGRGGTATNGGVSGSTGGIAGMSGSGGKGGAGAGGSAGVGGNPMIGSDWAAWRMPNPASTGLPNPSSYADNGDGTVTDRVTGLIWQKSVSLSTFTYSNAIDYCSGLNLAGRDDWRLPKIVELVSLLDYTRADPAIDTLAFPSTPTGAFWSATLCVGFVDHAWDVDFAEGYIYEYNGTTDLSYARCVRA